MSLSRPIYWYPSSYERSIRSALASSLLDRPEWGRIIIDDIDEDEGNIKQITIVDWSLLSWTFLDIFLNNDDEYERYPIPFDASDNPYGSFDLPQEYNMDDDDDDNGSNDYNDEEIYPVRYKDCWCIFYIVIFLVFIFHSFGTNQSMGIWENECNRLICKEIDK